MLRQIILAGNSPESEPQFQWAPTLGGECYAFSVVRDSSGRFSEVFQWAPTLGGECYSRVVRYLQQHKSFKKFQWAPTLGGECYIVIPRGSRRLSRGFNGHPPLGVNATSLSRAVPVVCRAVSMGTHPWG